MVALLWHFSLSRQKGRKMQTAKVMPAARRKPRWEKKAAWIKMSWHTVIYQSHSSVDSCVWTRSTESGLSVCRIKRAKSVQRAANWGISRRIKQIPIADFTRACLGGIIRACLTRRPRWKGHFEGEWGDFLRLFCHFATLSELGDHASLRSCVRFRRYDHAKIVFQRALSFLPAQPAIFLCKLWAFVSLISEKKS